VESRKIVPRCGWRRKWNIRGWFRRRVQQVQPVSIRHIGFPFLLQELKELVSWVSFIILV
jgi:hypothetical protein